MKRRASALARLYETRILFYFLSAVFILTISLTSAIAFSATITLAWDTNSEPDVAGYKIYYGTESREYIYVVDIGNQTSCTISDLVTGEVYYFAVTAYDMNDNESNFSAEINFEVPISAYQKSMAWIPLLLLDD